MRRFATVLPALLAVALLAPDAASARVVLVATGDGAVTLTAVETNRIAAQIPVGGWAGRTSRPPGPCLKPRSAGAGARPRPRRTARAGTSPRACGSARST